ncbi:MAG: hypothetical protein ACFBSF_10170 [Leptolyngbyaceae cyanobacterium]
MNQDKLHKQEQKTFTPELLLEQYKLYTEMTDRVSSRRIEANKFYTSLLTGLLALLSIVGTSGRFQRIIIFMAALSGIALSLVWMINIRSYKELNSLKFKVIHEMEESLPFPAYSREWQILKNNKEISYLRLTKIEQYVPLLLLIPFLILLVYVLII